jgi:hypothetical protein
MPAIDCAKSIKALFSALWSGGREGRRLNAAVESIDRRSGREAVAPPAVARIAFVTTSMFNFTTTHDLLASLTVHLRVTLVIVAAERPVSANSQKARSPAHSLYESGQNRAVQKGTVLSILRRPPA